MASDERQQPVVANGEPIGVNADKGARKNSTRGKSRPRGAKNIGTVLRGHGHARPCRRQGCRPWTPRNGQRRSHRRPSGRGASAMRSCEGGDCPMRGDRRPIGNAGDSPVRAVLPRSPPIAPTPRRRGVRVCRAPSALPAKLELLSCNLEALHRPSSPWSDEG
jgi:hypothetical protein